MARDRVGLAVATSHGLMLDLVRTYAPISRVELADRTGLTQATVSAVVRALIDEGLIVESGRGASTGGKPRTLLGIAAGARYAVGLQLGSESNSYAVVDLAGTVVGRIRTDGVAGNDPREATRAMSVHVAELLAALGVEQERVIGVGLVAPGPLDIERGTLLGSPQLTDWIDVPVRDILQAAVGLPVLLDNDATAAALGDFWSGDLADAHAHATVYMGAGIGSGVLINGAVLRGATSNSGELGQMILLTDQGRHSTVQELAAPIAVVNHAIATDPATAARYRLDADDSFAGFVRLAIGAAKEDPGAIAHLQRSAEYLALATLSMASLLDLDSVSLAGPAFADSGALYVRTIDRMFREEFFARERHSVQVRMSSQVSDAAAVGGAALVLQTFLAPRTMAIEPLRRPEQS